MFYRLVLAWPFGRLTAIPLYVEYRVQYNIFLNKKKTKRETKVVLFGAKRAI